jgi:hypothetical protein
VLLAARRFVAAGRGVSYRVDWTVHVTSLVCKLVAQVRRMASRVATYDQNGYLILVDTQHGKILKPGCASTAQLHGPPLSLTLPMQTAPLAAKVPVHPVGLCQCPFPPAHSRQAEALGDEAEQVAPRHPHQVCSAHGQPQHHAEEANQQHRCQRHIQAGQHRPPAAAAAQHQR